MTKVMERKRLKKELLQLIRVEKRKHHPLLHHIHKHHHVSRKTLFYIKEYGPHSNVVLTIIRESVKILLLASLISAFGGLALEHIKGIFVSIIPLVILLPALNDMVGDYGIIVSAKISTMLHEGIVSKQWWKMPELKLLFAQIMIVAIITSVLSAVIAIALPGMAGQGFSPSIASKVFAITIIDVSVLVTALFFVSVTAGLYVFRKKEDPNNVLIPIATSIGDMANMVLLAALVNLFF